MTKKLLKKLFEEKKQKRYFSLYFKGYKKIENELIKFISLIDKLEIEVLEPNVSPADLFKTMKEFHLLSNDALIAATCKNHGIKKIRLTETLRG